jgi:hypothetical protein
MELFSSLFYIKILVLIFINLNYFKMKNYTKLLNLVFLIAASSVYSQGANSMRVNLYGSYTFEDSFDSYYDYGNYYQGQLQDGFQYGIGAEFEARPNLLVEILYLRQDTNAPTQYYDGGVFDKYADFDVAMNFVLLGGTRSFRKFGSVIEGFGGFVVGVGVLNIQNHETSKLNSATKLAWGLRGGATIWASKKVGIKLQAQLLSIAQSIGGGFYYGTGGGGGGVSSYSSLYQFTLGGGLVFELGK